MSDRQALKATFFAFRRREKGGVLWGASVSFVIATVLLLALAAGAVWGLVGPSLFEGYTQAMGAASSGQPSFTPPDPSRALLIAPLAFLLLFFMFILLAAFEAATLRWMIRGERSGPLNLCFGEDMWRVYGTYWGWFVYVFVGWLTFLVAMFIIVAMTNAIGGAPGAIAAVALALCCLATWVWVTVRLSPAAATSVGIGEFAPLKAWSATRGRFWALFGSFVLLIIIYFIALSAVFFVVFGSFFGAALSGVDWSLVRTDPDAFARSYEAAMLGVMEHIFENPAMVALYLGGQIVTALVRIVFYLLFFGVNARAVQAALEEGKLTRAAST